ncbi:MULTISPECIES: carboxymuconolactone decarboxylase family protein [unclassified Rhodococcus (in: high G+C Gram-positive bacteria)]|uniref:carboxymuconolactone decarboxylase family protein n=1 Tax=unclassified Rhodococcus (in: high G+C Gram-positive bacteria) TaxID=192944 RepID=UPI0016395322|nr:MULTISPECIES: carboxymuconolactone decarboxylase family protein [unclassified Rhodococcus (in: high G+C Gram-positive bacteria)]MBC2637576.1 carboxymuconolactone decarboxylase family protein [Rhodococcus sp. 3A]MBC2644287.1 carboxymuconolactone decarboxylase family protein [Rhodococcus sp. 3A]MBC2890977.1 carboxymuconolactone decarboxylase family protein [Rhodococcus sp. 4CII]MBC2897678.1 carboxymuconolactone decarboxylase family protein [Rhodococcus sp. 4CII]
MDAVTEKQLDKHWNTFLGKVPPIIDSVKQLSPSYFQHYTQARDDVLQDNPDGLSLAMKELIFVIIDIWRENPSGGKNHIEAALRAGVTLQQIREAMVMILLCNGMVTYGRIGDELFQHALKIQGESE